MANKIVKVAVTNYQPHAYKRNYPLPHLIPGSLLFLLQIPLRPCDNLAYLGRELPETIRRHVIVHHAAGVTRIEHRTSRPDPLKRATRWRRRSRVHGGRRVLFFDARRMRQRPRVVTQLADLVSVRRHVKVVRHADVIARRQHAVTLTGEWHMRLLAFRSDSLAGGAAHDGLVAAGANQVVRWQHARTEDFVFNVWLDRVVTVRLEAEF